LGTGTPGFGVKITPAGRKIFIVLYRTAGADHRALRSGAPKGDRASPP